MISLANTYHVFSTRWMPQRSKPSSVRVPVFKKKKHIQNRDYTSKNKNYEKLHHIYIMEYYKAVKKGNE